MTILSPDVPSLGQRTLKTLADTSPTAPVPAIPLRINGEPNANYKKKFIPNLEYREFMNSKAANWDPSTDVNNLSGKEKANYDYLMESARKFSELYPGNPMLIAFCLTRLIARQDYSRFEKENGNIKAQDKKTQALYDMFKAAGFEDAEISWGAIKAGNEYIGSRAWIEFKGYLIDPLNMPAQIFELTPLDENYSSPDENIRAYSRFMMNYPELWSKKSD